MGVVPLAEYKTAGLVPNPRESVGRVLWFSDQAHYMGLGTVPYSVVHGAMN